MASKDCRPGIESVSPRKFIEEGLARKQNSANKARQKQLINSVKIFDKEAEQLEKIVSKPVFGFKERQHQAMYCDFMTFVAGVDVTPWIAGSLSISLVGRGSHNTASFSLQNANDNFVLTIKNILDPSNLANGWRNHDPDKYGSQYSEKAKYDIFKAKNTQVDPCEQPNNPFDQRIGIFKNPKNTCDVRPGFAVLQSETPGQGGLPPDQPAKDLGFVRTSRQWPLDPHRPIFHKHDPVRIFIHNPAVENDDSWLPAFCGFIDTYSFNEDYVTGESQITISCYDIRGIMQKMRVVQNVQNNIGSPNASTELADGSLNQGFFKDLLLAGSYSTFASYRTLKEVAEFMIAGKKLENSAPGASEVIVLTTRKYSSLTAEQEAQLLAQGGKKKFINGHNSSEGILFTFPEKKSTGVGNFKIGISSIHSSPPPCDKSGNQEKVPVLEDWYRLLLLGVKRSPATGVPIGVDGLPIIQPTTGPLCAQETSSAIEADITANKLAAETEIQNALGTNSHLIDFINDSGTESRKLTDEQWIEFIQNGAGRQITGDIERKDAEISSLKKKTEDNKKEIERLRSGNRPATYIPIQSFGPASTNQFGSGSTSTSSLDAKNKITALENEIKAAPEIEKKLLQDKSNLFNSLGTAQAKFKREQPTQDPNANNANAVPGTSTTDSISIIRQEPYSRNEALVIGQGTTWKGPWSPWNGYLHSLDVFEKSFIRSLTEVETVANFDTIAIEWKDRFSILNELTEKTDYQWWVTPIGDIVFEFPMYDFTPTAFGEFAPFMVFDKHLKNADFTDEAGDIPTLFIGQGSSSVESVAEAAKGAALTAATGRVILFAPTLASRIGIIPVQEHFPSFVGSVPNASAAEAAAKPNVIPTLGEIQSFLTDERKKNNIEEPTFLKQQRIVANKSEAPGSVGAILAFVAADLVGKIDALISNCSLRQTTLSKSVAELNAGNQGVSANDANSQLASFIDISIARLQKSNKLGSSQSAELKKFLIASYSISDLTQNKILQSNTLGIGQKDAASREAIRNWAILDFQRRLANSATFDQENEFRPFLFPNKPIHSIPRQRLGTINTVGNQMEINGLCSTKLSLANMKRLTHLSDGSLDFTHIAGGKNFPVDYNKMLFGKFNGFVNPSEDLVPNAGTTEKDSIIMKKEDPQTPARAKEETAQKQASTSQKAPVSITIGAAGLVTFAGFFNNDFGSAVMVDHKDGTRTIITNLDDIKVSVGQVVSADMTVIGTRTISGASIENILVRCDGNSLSSPAAGSNSANQSSAARNPPPIRSAAG